ncbi:hypothetical protein GCM10008949_44870 [Deinococcus humi]|nr:hypothetical protein GCM10008949_44870 [Deinococcus humi]
MTCGTSPLSQQVGQKGLRGLGIAVTLEEDRKHETVPQGGPPQSMSDTINTRGHLVEMPPGSSPLFPVAQVFSEEGSELDAPFAEGFVTDPLGRAGAATPARLSHSGKSGGSAK